MKEHTVSAYKKAIETFKKIEDWKDSSAKIYECERGIAEIEQNEEADRIEAERLAEEKRLEEERIAEEKRIADAKATKKRKRIIAIVTSIVCVCIAFVIVLNTVIIPNGKYNDALALMDSQKYEDAAVVLEKINKYKDSNEKWQECLYQQAVIYRNDKKWDDANKIFENIKDYKDSKDLLHYHDYSVIESKDASCTDSGYKHFKCNCGDEYTDNIAALGHSYSEASCTEAKKCSRCGATDGKALGHTTDSTVCSRCGVNTFKTLTYSGYGEKTIQNITLPKGKFNIKITASASSTNGGAVDAWIFDKLACMLIFAGESSSKEMNVSGPINNGTINMSGGGVKYCSWKITIEAQ